MGRSLNGPASIADLDRRATAETQIMGRREIAGPGNTDEK